MKSFGFQKSPVLSVKILTVLKRRLQRHVVLALLKLYHIWSICIRHGTRNFLVTTYHLSGDNSVMLKPVVGASCKLKDAISHHQNSNSFQSSRSLNLLLTPQTFFRACDWTPSAWLKSAWWHTVQPTLRPHLLSSGCEASVKYSFRPTCSPATTTSSNIVMVWLLQNTEDQTRLEFATDPR